MSAFGAGKSGQSVAYAVFMGLVLETMGTRSAATKYAIFAALSNTPIT